MKLSARNQIPGVIISVDRGPIDAKVKIDIGNGHTITSVISTEAVDELRLVAGSKCYAIIKASSVMVAVDR